MNTKKFLICAFCVFCVGIQASAQKFALVDMEYILKNIPAYEDMMQGKSISSYNSYAYDRFTLELRYPFMLGNTTIYGLGFLEAGNAWSRPGSFNPFDMKRSAGLGVRIFLPMVGLMGIDWAYGFDYVTTNQSGARSRGGSNFHFVLGQEF